MKKKWQIIAIDAVAVVLSFTVALVVRFEYTFTSKYLASLLLSIPVLLLLFLLANYVMGIYSGRRKYASFDELLGLTGAAFLSTVVLLVTDLLIPGARSHVPVSVALLGGLFSLFIMVLVRLQSRLRLERMLIYGERGSRKVLLIGAGEAGEMLARDMLRHPDYDFCPVGFVDDSPGKRNLVMQGLPVLGSREDIRRIVKDYNVSDIFITMPSATGKQLQEILHLCEETKAEIKILPGIFITMAGEVGIAAVREVRLEDLLGREPVETDLSSISAYISDRVVLITGAGGSIGSELSRQLCGLSPRRLLLLDRDSTALFDLEMDLAHRTDVCPTENIIADVRDADRLEAVFKRYRPQVIFHSAALKHVPMLESHPSEAVKNNVLGTRNLALVAIKHRVERFILISTDKAVQPVNVMGATKRLAEYVAKDYNGRNGTRFAAVRFGNVLGSRGSVVPVFKKQIEDGGPVLVTHPEITRYFMTIEEAAQLVIQAGAYTEGGDIFILDMGEPVRIADLAKEMVRLMGRGRDVEIRISGLRPGEKLHEKLVFQSEEVMPTAHSKINRVVEDCELPRDFDAQIDTLVESAVRDDERDIRRRLSSLVSCYEPRPVKEEGVEVESDARSDL